MPHILIAALIATTLSTVSCTQSTTVQQYGGMRDVLRMGNTQPRVTLSHVVSKPGSIAVGALAGLGGEITIIDGDVWVARSRAGNSVVTGPTVHHGDQATLLTVAYVSRWVDVPLPNGASSNELDAVIANAARSVGVDTTKPFPFIIEGDLLQVEAHVIAGSCPIANPSGEPPWRLSRPSPAPGLLVGFYAEGAEGVMTHHGSPLHAHVVLDRTGTTITAHADSVAVGPEAVIRVPAS